jgi:predicted SprT family Zn-dependent metalloprotease
MTPEIEAFRRLKIVPKTRMVPGSRTVQVTEQSVREWLSKVVHNPRGKHRRLRRYATAYYRKQMIVYNPLFLQNIHERGDWDLAILDTVLHELGHLFTCVFYNTFGHDWTWQAVGGIVGYAPVGSSSDANRKTYAAYAAHAASVVDVKSDPVSQFDTSGGRVNPGSTVRRPVETVWFICNNMPNAARKDVIAKCIEYGVNPNTAATQYAAWKRYQKRGYN